MYTDLCQPKMEKQTNVNIGKNKYKYKYLRRQKVKTFGDDSANKEIYCTESTIKTPETNRMRSLP